MWIKSIYGKAAFKRLKLYIWRAGTVTAIPWMSVAWRQGGGQSFGLGSVMGWVVTLRNMVGETKCLSVLWDSPPSSLGWQMYVEMPQGVGQVLLSLANWLFVELIIGEAGSRAPLWQSGGQEGYLKSWVVWPEALRASSKPGGEVNFWEGNSFPAKRARLLLSDVWCSAFIYPTASECLCSLM